jgi:hypothetical protein
MRESTSPPSTPLQATVPTSPSSSSERLGDVDRTLGSTTWGEELNRGNGTTPIPQADVRRATRLIAWGLRPTLRPQQHEEYRELVERFQQDPLFQQAVVAAAGGSELQILSCGPHGLILVAGELSPFLLKPADFRGNTDVEGRMLDGLIQIAIAATIYPRSAELFEPYELARAPITAIQVQETLDLIVDRLREAAKGARDPGASAETQGLLEAWRVYDQKPRVRETRDGRAAHNTIRQQITLHLQRLRDQGCMVEGDRGGQPQWQSTFRYHLLVQEYAYGPVYDAAKALGALPDPAAERTPQAS